MYKFSITLFVAFLILNVMPNHAHPRFSGGDNDSLLIDGEEEYTDIPYQPADDEECQVVVVDAPCAWGDIYQKKIGSVCGVKDTIIRVKKDQVLKNGDILVPGSIIRTCPADLPNQKNAVENTVIAVVLQSGGKTMFINFELAPNSESYVPNPDATCRSLRIKNLEPIKFKLNKGKMYSNISDDIRASLIVIGEQVEQAIQNTGITTVGAFNTIIEHVHTKFSVEINTDGPDTVDIVRVYEGSATVKLAKSPPSNKNENKEQIDQLQKDYKDGKISMQEFKDKLTDLTTNMTKKALDTVPVEVTAGNMCVATNHSLTVTPIDSGDDQWWNK